MVTLKPDGEGFGGGFAPGWAYGWGRVLAGHEAQHDLTESFHFTNAVLGHTVERRLAALPVGAQSRHRTFLARRINRMALTKVVLPTPRPPVMTKARLDRASLSASRWPGASSLPVFCWHQTTAFSKSISENVDGELARFLIRPAMISSARFRDGRNSNSCPRCSLAPDPRWPGSAPIPG
jgi:hypothetical protein